MYGYMGIWAIWVYAYMGYIRYMGYMGIWAIWVAGAFLPGSCIACIMEVVVGENVLWCTLCLGSCVERGLRAIIPVKL